MNESLNFERLSCAVLRGLGIHSVKYAVYLNDTGMKSS